MTNELHIARGFYLPVETVAQPLGILAMRGAGKSNAAVVMAEEMFAAGIPWCAIDPKGDWHGIRSSRDGKKPGLGVPVFGGLHADVPLHADGGSLLADLIVDTRLTCIVDVSDFSKGEQTRFLIDFAERLFRRQRSNPEPMHMFLEEAHEYLPQRVMRDQARLVGAWSKIVKQGRSFGLGVTVISQRSASLNKDVLTQVGTLIVLRTTSPQDRKAIKDWVDEYDVDKTMLSSLPSLEDGEAWIWSPQFLRVFERVKFRQRMTFDSGATPKLGQVRKPSTLADIDVKAIESKWAESIQRAKEEDPKELKKTIRNLEALIRELEMRSPEPAEPVIERVPILPDGFAEDILLTRKTAENLIISLENIDARLQEFIPQAVERVVSKVSSTRKAEVPPVRPSGRLPAPSDGSLSGMQRKILTVLAQHGPRSIDQLLLQTGYRKGGAWNTALARLREQGLIEGNPVKITTPAGVTALGGDYEPLPSGMALYNYWKSELGTMAGAIMDALRKQEHLTIDMLLEDTRYKVGGAWNTAMSRLRKLNIIEGNPVRFTDEFREACKG